MASQNPYMQNGNLWNPNEEFDLDPETGQYRPRQPDWSTAAPAPSYDAAPTYDIDAWYQRKFGRGPDAQERASDLANIEKYGAGAFEADFEKRMGNGGAQAATAQYSGGGGSGYGGVTGFQSGLRDILMQQLGAMGQAPTVNDPGIRENLAGQRLALQRSTERQRAGLAERLAGGGLASSGAAETGRLGLEQARGEAEARGVGDVLGGELQGRRQQLAQLLQMALATGDAESARAIQERMFDDEIAFRYTNLNQQGNLQALMALLGAA